MLNNIFWSKYFKVYDVLNLVEPYADLMEQVSLSLKIRPGDQVLDAGCGTGNVAMQIKKHGGEVIGIDNCEPALEQYKKKSPTAQTMICDLTKPLDFPDASFDKIASNNVLYTLGPTSQEALMKEFFRILRPGGIVAIVNPKNGWSPVQIYTATIRQKIKKDGFVKTCILLGQLLWPTIKMFYYNYQIRKEGAFYFPTKDEQERMFVAAPFTEIHSVLVYADQAYLTTATRPR